MPTAHATERRVPRRHCVRRGLCERFGHKLVPYPSGKSCSRHTPCAAALEPARRARDTMADGRRNHEPRGKVRGSLVLDDAPEPRFQLARLASMAREPALAALLAPEPHRGPHPALAPSSRGLASSACPPRWGAQLLRGGEEGAWWRHVFGGRARSAAPINQSLARPPASPPWGSTSLDGHFSAMLVQPRGTQRSPEDESGFGGTRRRRT